jgi:hypothetical protein
LHVPGSFSISLAKFWTTLPALFFGEVDKFVVLIADTFMICTGHRNRCSGDRSLGSVRGFGLAAGLGLVCGGGLNHQ